MPFPGQTLNSRELVARFGSLSSSTSYLYSGGAISELEQEERGGQTEGRALQAKVRARNVSDQQVKKESDRKHEQERKDSDLQFFPEHDFRSPAREDEADDRPRFVFRRSSRFRSLAFVQREAPSLGRFRMP